MIRDEALKLALASRGAVVLPIVAGDRSMEPTLAGGDAVLAVPMARPPVPGDLLVFLQKDELVVHRFLGPARRPDGAPCLRTRGDGRRELDPPLDAASVRGYAVAVRRAGTWRSLEGAGPRTFARLVALHDLAWAAAIHVLRPLGLSAAAAAVDRGLLRLGTGLLLPVTHPRIPSPEPPGAGVSV